ncbi:MULTISPECIES: sensor histidine kinase KdpD [unclassified Brachybacterium]|uniref:sensor histidine kinase n=1 Tax=unclassified Brachybacterium TaxID=2623841 RepID=UPI000C80FB72|nr:MULTISPECIES: HAMP domain-containing sensor histidine kinase [unclassified Brachybacterium]PMC75721.1 sensor histidine kinase [Brachybacterium sp. UMB0905]
MRRFLLSALLALPALGLVTSLVWWLLGGGPDYRITGSLTWVPVLVGLLAALALLPTLAVGALVRRREEHVRAEAQQEHAERRRRLLARLDHEMKNPIQGIRAALADEPSDRQRASIDLQARRLSGLLGDLRKISEVEHATLERSTVNLAELVDEVVLCAGELPGASQRRLGISLPRAPRPLPPVSADSDLLFLALSNVLTNAVKYSAPGDAIEIRGREEDGQVVLEIADTGRGIPADELALVWEELERSREVRGTEGSGLGLPMVRAIMERHGGTANLASWHGQGSTVTLRLPAAPAGG